MITAIYARYSSDMQSERSIDDQIEACTAFALQRGLPAPTMHFADAAISGASMATRPQLLALLELVRARRVSVVIAEAVDRLSRDQADVHLIRRACEANNVKLYTMADGEVSGMVAGLQGIMAEAFLKNLGMKTRRGMMGVARSGRIAGGLCYGYRPVDGKPGEREIDEAQAAVVRRIFADYIAGLSPYAIARALNGEGVAGPRGALWKANTITGDARAGDGVLCNPLYRGRIVFNRRRYVKNPETGKRSGFLNPRAEWIVVERPGLRIVDDESFEAAQKLRRAVGAAPLQNRTRRPQRLLSGILSCAACGARLAIRNRGRYACANAVNGAGLCEVRASIPAVLIERRVIDGLKRTLLAPEIIAEAVRAYHEERKAMASADARARRAVERDLAEAARRASRIADQLIDTPSPTLAAKLAEAETTMATAEAALAALPGDSIVEMHPNAAAAYKARVASLETALAAEAHPAIASAVRGLLERIELAPNPEAPDGWEVVVHGRLAALLALGQEKTPGLEAGGRMRSELGAGARTGRWPTVGEPTLRMTA